MNKKIISKVVAFCILLFFSVLSPTIIANAETTKNFSVKVDTDKESYLENEEINYTITVKNTSGQDVADLVIQDELPENVQIIECNGTVTKQTVKWTYELFEKDEEVKLTLKIKLNEEKSDVVVKPEGEGSKPDNSQDITVGTSGGNNNNSNGGLPLTGGTNGIIIISAALILVIGGSLIYKRKDKKVTISIILVVALGTSVFANIEAVYADTILIKEEFSHVLKVNDIDILSKITIEGAIEEEQVQVPILKLIDDNGYLEFEIENYNDNYDYVINIMKNNTLEIDNVKVESSKEIVIYPEDSIGSYQYKVVAVTSNGIETQSNTINYIISEYGAGVIENDSDDDGLDDDLEEALGTDPFNPDTDGDGLPDGYEYYITDTDPLKADSDDNSILDGDEDLDNDGLTNLDEMELGTDPLKPDTDGDGLSDGDEVNIYGTNPLVRDTDGDNLTDNDEIILGFDPLNPDTNGNGILDGDEKVEQEIGSNNIADELLVDNDAIPSLTVVTNGNVNNKAIIREYNGVELGESRAVIGKPIELYEFEFDSGELIFDVSDEINFLVSSNGEEFSKFIICNFDEEEGTTYIPTDYDNSNNTLKAEIEGNGVYFLVDVEIMFAELGITIPVVKADDISTMSRSIIETDLTEFTEEELQDMSNNQSVEEVVDENELDSILDGYDNSIQESYTMERSIFSRDAKGQADIVFVVDTTGSMGSYINNVKTNILYFIDALVDKGIAPNFALVDFQDITYDGLDSTKVHKNGTSNWFTNAESYKNAISSLVLGNGGDIPECAIDALETARLLDLRSAAGKFFVLVTDATYKVDNRYGIPSMDYEIELLKNSDINVSVVAPNGLEYTYRNLYSETNGIFANINGNFYNQLMAIADKIGDEVVDNGVWVYLQGAIPVPAKLLEYPTEGSTVDTDGDGITDVDELESIVPVEECDLDKIITIASKGIITGTNYGKVKAYKYKSNPAVADTDGDGYNDDEDLAPKEEFVTPVVLLHGRGDNTADCFGLINDLYDKYLGKKYNSDYGKSTSSNGLNYTSYKTQQINDYLLGDGSGKTPGNLGTELLFMPEYKINQNLFAFNYPNKDMTRENAEKLRDYLNNLAKEMSSKSSSLFYPTKEAKENNKIYVNLVGHSNGGLVSRYYIENLGYSNNVEKLVTIDTPHWGSGLADISDNLTTCYPMDIDLNPNNAIFGGTYKTYSSLNPFVKDKLEYINNNQTDPLKYSNHGNTKYYFLAGYDVTASVDVPISYLSKNMDFDINMMSYSNFGEYKNNIKNSFISNSSYSDLAYDKNFSRVFNLKSSDGDNVVNNQSQLGLKFEDDKDSSVLLKSIKAEKMWMNIDTYLGHNMAFHFHGQNQHRTETIDRVIDYLLE